jgi:hypothetical protein
METAGIDLSLDEFKTPAIQKEAVAAGLSRIHKGKEEYAPPYYTINIASVEGLPEFEVVGVNGEVLQIRRGVDVPNIPECFVKNLRTCMSKRQVTKLDANGKEYNDWVPYPAIPYQIIEGPYMERKKI